MQQRPLTVDRLRARKTNMTFFYAETDTSSTAAGALIDTAIG